MSVSELFEEVIAKINTSKALPLSENVKLKLYGHYKGATVGKSFESNEHAPSLFNIVARKKWYAWVECDRMTKDECMLAYIKIVADIDCDLGTETRQLLKEFRVKHEKTMLDLGDLQ